jgi:hypothetical protein
MQFTCANCCNLVAIGRTTPHAIDSLNVHIGNNGVLVCKNNNGFILKVNLQFIEEIQEYETPYIIGSQFEVESLNITCLISDGSVLACNGVIYPSEGIMKIYSVERHWFWFEVRPHALTVSKSIKGV